MFNLELEQVRDLNSEMKKYYRPLPELSHLQSVPNTMIACRTCRGQRVIAVKSKYSYTITYKHCFACRGTGITHID